jgi:UDP-N-acetylglucosamine--N-acetylmuramyl-(pentapeptide) pyrophosphoryl-undecaprenol N-acetylglucosamine transferase
MGCPTVLLNLDDPPGKANRLATRWADAVLSTVDCSLPNAVHVPPPLRQSVLAPDNAKLCYKKFGLDPHRMTLLVTGASQGANSLNKFIPELAKNHPMQFQGWQVLHISGPEHSTEVKKAWGETNVPFHVVEFVQNMGEAWGITDLAISRGGANTIAELAMNAVPAIVFPYPYHKDDHQRTNALPLASTGGILIEKDYIQPSQNLLHGGRSIITLLKDHHQRFEMRQSLVSKLPINGAIVIAETCLAGIKGE